MNAMNEFHENELLKCEEYAKILIEREYDMYDLEMMDIAIKKKFPALVAEVRRLTNLVEALALVTEDETGMLSDAPLTAEKLEEILHTLKGQRDYAAETAEMHAKEVERLNKLVCFARLYISDGNNIDGMSHIDFAEKNGIYQEYLDAISWDQVFQDALKGGAE